MNQDTRKDKRAKVVSLNVRYKSATVDEFIENHSHDVSKGGLFVKTPTPFPPGTLLKFEIRLAGDKSVISGVGRVVWKREPTQAAADKPAGMGVKFIKIDDSSRAIIDRLVGQKADAGSAYTSEKPHEEAGNATTLRGLAVGAPTEPSAAPGPLPVNVPAPAPAGSRLPFPYDLTPSGGLPDAAGLGGPPGPARKNAVAPATLVGPRPSGLPNLPPSRPTPPPGPSSRPALRATGSVKMPTSTVPPRAAAPPISTRLAATADPTSEPRLPGEGPPRPPASGGRKATIMGIGSSSSRPPSPNEPHAALPPPWSGAGPSTPTPVVGKAARPVEPMFPRLDPESGSEPARGQTVMKQAAELLEEALLEAGGSLDDIGQNPLFIGPGDVAKDARPNQAPRSIETRNLGSPSQAPASLAMGGSGPGAPLAAVSRSSSTSGPVDASAAATGGRRLKDDLDSSSKKGESGALAGVLVVLVVILVGGAFAWQKGWLAGLVGTPPRVEPERTEAPPPSAPTAALSAGAGQGGATSPVNSFNVLDAQTGTEANDGSVARMVADGGAAVDAGSAVGKEVKKAAPDRPPTPWRPVWRPPAPKPPSATAPAAAVSLAPTSTPSASASTPATASTTTLETSSSAPIETSSPKETAPAPAPVVPPTKDPGSSDL